MQELRAYQPNATKLRNVWYQKKSNKSIMLVHYEETRKDSAYQKPKKKQKAITWKGAAE